MHFDLTSSHVARCRGGPGRCVVDFSHSQPGPLGWVGRKHTPVSRPEPERESVSAGCELVRRARRVRKDSRLHALQHSPGSSQILLSVGVRVWGNEPSTQRRVCILPVRWSHGARSRAPTNAAHAQVTDARRPSGLRVTVSGPGLLSQLQLQVLVFLDKNAR